MKSWEIPYCEPAKTEFAAGAPKFQSIMAYVMDAKEFPDQLPEQLKGLFASKILVEDTLKSKTAWVYAIDTTLFERCFIALLEKGDRNEARATGTKIVEAVQSKSGKSLGLWLSSKISEDQVQGLMNGITLTNYDLSHKMDGVRKNIPEISFFMEAEQLKAMTKLPYYSKLYEGAIHARNYVNQTGSVATPEYMQNQAEILAKSNPDAVKLECIIGKELVEKGLNCLHAVGMGGSSEPRLVAIHYKGKKESDEFSHAFVGKGVTFDTGGLNLKPTGGIESMYLDKGGACAVLGAMKVLIETKAAVNVIGCMVLAENAVDNKSYHPSDIIKSYSGLTVVVDNTDAEGRLCLMDGMSYIQRNYKPKKLVDICTLTGAIIVALGPERAGLFSNDDEFAKEFEEAAKDVFEKSWRMPVGEEYDEFVKAPNADLSNIGAPPPAGASKAACFLKAVVEKDVKWVHFDIAGTAISKSQSGTVCRGGTGFGANTLVRLVTK